MELFLKHTGIYLIAFLLALCFFKVNGFFSNKNSEIIKSDGLGYYSYLPAIFIYNDSSQSFVDKKAAKYYNNFAIPEYIQNIDNKSVDKYFFGTAVMMYPFFITAHWLTLYFHLAPDGYSILYQYFIGFSAVFYIFVGIFFCNRLLRLYGATTYQSLLICALLVFGTNLFFYGVVESSMSHAFSFAMISAFLFFSKGIFEIKKAGYIIPAFISLGLLILIRPFNMMIILAIPFLAGSFEKLSSGIRFILNHYFITFLGTLIAFVIISLQFIIWHWETGHFIVYSYTYERFYFNRPNIINVLFSYRKGLFIYTPLCFLSLAGLILLFKQNRFSVISFLLFFLFLVYVMSCWHEWYYGASFGFRPMVEYFSLFSILLLFSLKLIRTGIWKNIFVVLCLFTLYINQVQAYQYRKFILHWNGMSRFKYWEVFLKTNEKWNGYVWDNPEPDDLVGTQVDRYATDFEGNQKEWTVSSLLDIGTKAHSGKTVAALNESVMYSSTLLLEKNSKLINCAKPAVVIMGYVHANNYFTSDKLKCVVSYDKKNEGTYFYKSRTVENYFRDKNGWKRFEIAIKLDKLQSDSDVVKIYFWNPEKKSYWIDDVTVKFISQI